MITTCKCNIKMQRLRSKASCRKYVCLLQIPLLLERVVCKRISVCLLRANAIRLFAPIQLTPPFEHGNKLSWRPINAIVTTSEALLLPEASLRTSKDLSKCISFFLLGRRFFLMAPLRLNFGGVGNGDEVFDGIISVMLIDESSLICIFLFGDTSDILLFIRGWFCVGDLTILTESAREFGFSNVTFDFVDFDFIDAVKWFFLRLWLLIRP